MRSKYHSVFLRTLIVDGVLLGLCVFTSPSIHSISFLPFWKNFFIIWPYGLRFIIHFAMELAAAPKQVSFQHEDRQWDARFNVQTEEDVTRLLDAARDTWESGKLKYLLIGGVEVGTRPFQDDYQIRHVHAALIFHNRTSKRAVLKHLAIKQGNGYYLVPRNRDLPYSGWKNHHIKEFSKVDAEKTILYEMGTLPQDLKRKRVEASEEEKKRPTNDCLIEMRKLIEEGEEDKSFQKFPRLHLQYGERLKSMVNQKRDFAKHEGNPHIWVHGFPGTGKSAVLNFIYPKYYKKNLYNKFFDLYDPNEHSHVMLEDVDHKALETLTVNFFKTICDEAGFPIDQKYKTPQLARTTVLITSNFTIAELVADTLGATQTKNALYRRFWHIGIYSLLRILGLKLLPKQQRADLAKEGNTDPAKIFIAWDYTQDVPTGKELKEPEYYQKELRDYYYAMLG